MGVDARSALNLGSAGWPLRDVAHDIFGQLHLPVTPSGVSSIRLALAVSRKVCRVSRRLELSDVAIESARYVRAPTSCCHAPPFIPRLSTAPRGGRGTPSTPLAAISAHSQSPFVYVKRGTTGGLPRMPLPPLHSLGHARASHRFFFLHPFLLANASRAHPSPSSLHPSQNKNKPGATPAEALRQTT